MTGPIQGGGNITPPEQPPPPPEGNGFGRALARAGQAVRNGGDAVQAKKEQLVARAQDVGMTQVARLANSPAGAALVGVRAAQILGRARIQSDAPVTFIAPDRAASSRTPPAPRPLGAGLSAQYGQPAAIPAEHWIGGAASPFAARTPIDLSLHPAITRPIEAVGRIVGPPARLVGTIMGATAKATSAIGVTSLATGLLTGTLKAGICKSGSTACTPEQQSLDRIVNQPKGAWIASLSAAIPYTPPQANLRSAVYAVSLPHSYVFEPVLEPGKRGVPLWFSMEGGRVRAISQYNLGLGIFGAGFATGSKNFSVNHIALTNIPRANAPMVRADLLPVAGRLTPADIQVGGLLAPISLVYNTDFNLGPVRVTQGALISPLAGRVMVGTNGFAGSSLTAGGLDRTPFFSVAANPAFDPADPAWQAAQRVLNGLKP